ncbi:hypothetical protein ACFFU1_00985 [Algibacter miyuki]|uniref:Secretion system C-terminal sorting domain-containing protein n=1 Tax=Algibacter miyuki TaxID=1306933 RepID=A0ABV5GV04_9FLAO|nr:hypothetical protein [Algibacter miyuki]MDN3664784.1 hypothetical protein [Algibacter miyuki]
MKNVIKHSKKILFAVTLFTASLGHAIEKDPIADKGVIKTALIISNVKEGNLLSIKDLNGNILYKESISETGTYKKGFDLTALPNGDYFFEVDKDLEVKTIPFTVKDNNVVFNKTEEITVFKPYIKEQGDFILISKLAPNFEALDISIYANYNGDFELLHSDKIENTQTIKKAYKLEKGSYKIVFNSDNHEYIEYINK